MSRVFGVIIRKASPFRGGFFGANPREIRCLESPLLQLCPVLIIRFMKHAVLALTAALLSCSPADSDSAESPATAPPAAQIRAETPGRAADYKWLPAGR